MPNFKNIFRYWMHYGTNSLIGHVWELVIINPYRFRLGYQRKIPVFPERGTLTQTVVESQSTVKKSLKICYLIHYFYPSKKGGTERFVLNMAKQQRDFGHTAFVITFGNLSLSEYDERLGDLYYRIYRYEDVPVVEIRHKKAPRGLYYKELEEQDSILADFANSLLEKEKIDVVHAAYPQPFYSFILAAREKQVPVVLTGTDFNLFCHYATMVNKKGDFCSGSLRGNRCDVICKTYGCRDLKRRFHRANDYIHTVQAVTVPSEFVAQVFEQEFPDIHVQVVPHGIDQNFKNLKERCQTKRFVYAGTLSELKGVHLLIAAFEKIAGDIQLDIYGATNSSYAKKLMRTKDQRICFHGAVGASEMIAVYQQADCVVVPSIWYETYNFVVREALTCGCLVIASNIGAMPEAIIEEQNGFLFQAGNQEALKNALDKAVHFDWSQYRQSSFPTLQEEGKTYEQLYQRIVKN